MQEKPQGVPTLFHALSAPRRLLALAAFTLAAGAAMLPAMATMSDHGHSVLAFERADSPEESEEILADWGQAGKDAAWWQLALDVPFLVGYGLLAAGACAAVARRAEAADEPRLLRAATVLVWFGPVAAAADVLQNVSLDLVLGGHVTQPWPLISAVCVPLIQALMVVALAFALVGTIATIRTRAAV
jgi:hypothetical protein